MSGVSENGLVSITYKNEILLSSNNYEDRNLAETTYSINLYGEEYTGVYPSLGNNTSNVRKYFFHIIKISLNLVKKVLDIVLFVWYNYGVLRCYLKAPRKMILKEPRYVILSKEINAFQKGSLSADL